MPVPFSTTRVPADTALVVEEHRQLQEAQRQTAQFLAAREAEAPPHPQSIQGALLAKTAFQREQRLLAEARAYRDLPAWIEESSSFNAQEWLRVNSRPFGAVVAVDEATSVRSRLNPAASWPASNLAEVHGRTRCFRTSLAAPYGEADGATTAAQVRSNNYVAKTDLEPGSGWVLSAAGGVAASPASYPVGPATDDDIDIGWQAAKVAGVQEEHSSAWFEAGVRFAERRLGVKEKE